MTAITSGRVTIPAWRVMRAAWLRNRMTLTSLLAAFTVTAGWTLYQADSMRSWLIARHIQQCITPVNASSSACEADPAWQRFASSFHAYTLLFLLLGAPVVLAMFGGVRWLTLLRGWLTDHAGHVAPGFLITHDGGMTLPGGQLGTMLTTGSAATQRAWLAAHHYTYWISYQPHSRLLIFQATWAGTLLTAAIAAFGLATWRVTASR